MTAKQKVIPTLGKVEMVAERPSLDDVTKQAIAIREENRIKFIEAYQQVMANLEKEYGHIMDPVFEMSGSKGAQLGFNAIPTR